MNENDDVRARIEKLKQEAASISEGPVTSGMAPDCPPELEEQFWKQIIAFETAPQIEPIALLERKGLTVPPPGEVEDANLTSKLWEVIRGLAAIDIYLESTDHLSDRELYVRLWNDVLHDPMELELDDGGAWHVDLVGNCSEEEVQLYLKYYADDQVRRHHAQEWPDDPLPPRVPPPFDRDRYLPRRPF